MTKLEKAIVAQDIVDRLTRSLEESQAAMETTKSTREKLALAGIVRLLSQVVLSEKGHAANAVFGLTPAERAKFEMMRALELAQRVKKAS